MAQRRILVAAILVCSLGSAPTAAAQARGFGVNRFEPAERGSDWFVGESLDFRGDMRPAFGVVFDWAYKPLVLYDPSNLQGDPRGNVITDQVFMHAGGALVLRDRVRLGVDVPVALFQDGEDVTALAVAARAPEKAALGDLRLAGDVRVLGEYGDHFTAAIGAQVHLPTGNRSLFTGDGTVRFVPHVLVAGAASGFPYAAKLGFAYRPFDSAFEGRPLGSEAMFALAIGVKANDQFVFGPELSGSTVVKGGQLFATRSTPVEMLVGAHVRLVDRWQAGAAVGPGFTRGDGAPTMRVVVSLELMTDVCIDKDGDGICATEDACPEVDGVHTTDPKTNGCPPVPSPDGSVSEPRAE